MSLDSQVASDRRSVVVDSHHPTRRQFVARSAGLLGLSACSSLSGLLGREARGGEEGRADERCGADSNTANDSVAFFLIGDTHYLADKNETGRLDERSSAVTSRLIETLNRLPGTTIPEPAGGGAVAAPRGVIHAGDIIDSGDKAGGPHPAMQKTEWAGFEVDFGLSGKEGKLKLPVFEVHGNHDSPHGAGLAIDEIKRRNKSRPGLAAVSSNGLHYSWNWGGVHFVNLGIVVGSTEETKRRRRYAPLDSLQFLVDDLKQHAADGKPVVITHHVDMARYSLPCDPTEEAKSHEWDPCDVQAYYRAIKDYRVAGILYGHTHVRNVYRWNGTQDTKQATGLPVFNTDNVSHFSGPTQALFYCEITAKQLVMREYSTKDSWESGQWTPQVWKVELAG